MNINWALLVSYAIAIIIEVGLPLAAGIWLMRKYKSSWVLILTGLVTYALAELIHIPALNGIKTLFSNGTLASPASRWIPLVNGLIVGALAGIIENCVRWIGFKVNGKRSDPFRSAVSLGIGHGGLELILVGVLLAINLGSVLFYNAGAQIAKGVSTTSVQSVLAQITSFWAAPWYYAPLGLFEHLVTFAAQLALSVMVWRAVAKSQPLWLLLAVLYQTVVEGITTFLSGMNWGLWQIEGVLALFLLLSVLMMYLFWGEEGGLGEDEDDEDEESEDDEEEDSPEEISETAVDESSETK